MWLPKPPQKELGKATDKHPGLGAVLRIVFLARRIGGFVAGLALLLVSTWIVGVGLVTGRMTLGHRSGMRGGAMVSEWSRNPVEFVFTALLLLALAAFGLYLVVRAFRRR